MLQCRQRGCIAQRCIATLGRHAAFSLQDRARQLDPPLRQSPAPFLVHAQAWRPSHPVGVTDGTVLHIHHPAINGRRLRCRRDVAPISKKEEEKGTRHEHHGA